MKIDQEIPFFNFMLTVTYLKQKKQEELAPYKNPSYKNCSRQKYKYQVKAINLQIIKSYIH